MNEVGVFKRVHTHTQQTQSGVRIPSKKDIFPSAVLFLVSRCTFAQMSPFAAALFASAYDKNIAYLGIIVSFAGTLSAGLGIKALGHLTAMVIFWLYSRLREDYKTKNILSSAVCGAGMLAGSLAAAVYTSATAYDIMLILSEAIISTFMYIVFKISSDLLSTKRKKLSQEEVICFCISAGAVIMGFSGLVFPFGIEATHLLSAYAVMLLAMNTSLAASGAGAVATGMICGAAADSLASLMGLYGFCGIISNMLKIFGKYGVMLGFLSACAVIMLCEGSSFCIPINIAEIIGAGFMFIITPNSVHGKISDFFKKTRPDEKTNTAERVREYVVNRLSQMAAAFSTLSDSFKSIGEKRLNMSDVTVIFDDTAERVCKGCGMASHCWQRSFNDTYRDMFFMLSVIEQSGKLSVKDMPEDFSKRCIKADKLVNCFAHTYELYKERAVWTGEIAENRSLLAEQYGEISSIITKLADETEDGFLFLEETEKQLEYELDRMGISADNISIMQRGNRSLAVTMNVYGTYSPEEICIAAETVVGKPFYIDYTSITDQLTLVSGCEIEIDVGLAQACKSGESDNGDSMMDFVTSDGIFAVAISDGMGSGSRAMEESSMTTNLLESFIKAGFDRNICLSIINSSLALRAEHECFSTVDLLLIDKGSGIAEFVKAGAPESYVLSGESIETVFSSSLPAGMITGSEADLQKRTLNKGDVIVMMSDGVSDAGKSLVRGEWIKKKMLSDFADAQSLAEDILSGAKQRSHSAVNDDMSVAVVRIV